MEHKSYLSNIEYKSNDNNDLSISGYASVFNLVDSYNDIVEPGAFKETLGHKIKLLWQHDHTKPIGVINRLYEDTKGLFMEATINCNIAQGRETALLITQGALDALSIGFTINKSHFSKTGERVLTDVKLWEVSVVTFPANSHAQINKKEKNEMIDNKRFENLEEKYSQIEAMIHRPEIETSVRDNGFGRYIRSGIADMEMKALSGLNNDTGGYTIIPELYKEIIGGITAKSPMRKLASIETISTNALDILLEDENFTTGWVAEGAARPETNTAKLAQKRILVHELYAQPKATQKLLDDAAININSWLMERLQDSFVRAENNSFIIGDGNNKPKGILSYGEDEVERIDVEEEGSLTMEDILNLINSLDETYLGNASFLMHRSTLLEIQKLKDENGRFLWQASLNDSHPATLLGIPVICASDMPQYDKKALGIALADFKEAYKIVDRSDITIMRDPFTEKPFIKFYSVKRVGGDIVNSEAIKLLKC